MSQNNRKCQHEKKNQSNQKQQKQNKVNKAEEQFIQEFIAMLSQIIYDLEQNPKHRKALKTFNSKRFVSRVAEIVGFDLTKELFK